MSPESTEHQPEEGRKRQKKTRKPVWQDAAEEEEFPSKRSLVEDSLPKWAIPQLKKQKLPDEEGEGEGDSSAAEDPEEEGADEEALQDAVDEMLRSTGRLTATRGTGRLPADSLGVALRSDVNAASKSSVSPSCVVFHPSAASGVVLVAAPDNHVKLFRLGPKRNALVQSIHIRNLQPVQALFDPTGSKVYVSGGRGTCCIIDSATYQHRFVTDFLRNHKYEKELPAFGLSPDGKHLAFVNPTGRCFVVASHTFTPVGSMKMGEALNDVAFDPDNAHYMYLCGGGKVYTWDLRNMQEPLSQCRDDGAFDCTRLAVSHAHVAVGSNVGIVNVYNKPVGGCFASAAPPPLKVLKNIVVPIDHLRFNHDGQLLFFGARAKGQSRMANMGTMTVFPNFPGPLVNLSCMAMDFSPDSTSFAFGALDCRVLHARLLHYSSAKRLARKARRLPWAT